MPAFGGHSAWYSIPIMRLGWLLAALIFASLLAYGQVRALDEFLYWRYPWFDLPMHFLGGLALASLAIGFLHELKPKTYIVFMIIVAFGWELFELVIGTDREANYAFDTALDILMDTLGMVLAYIVARFTIWRSV